MTLSVRFERAFPIQGIGKVVIAYGLVYDARNRLFPENPEHRPLVRDLAVRGRFGAEATICRTCVCSFAGISLLFLE